MARSALTQGRHGAGTPATFSPEDVTSRALAEVGRNQQTWDRSDLLWALSNALPANLGVPVDEVRTLLESLADAALDPARGEAIVVRDHESVDDLPDELRLANGRSSYERPAVVRYTTRGQVVAERLLQDAAVRTGAAKLEQEVAEELVGRYRRNGHELGADQQAAMLGVLTSGAQVEILAAAAGTGKSWTVGAIAEMWGEQGRRTFGLAASQGAADVLAEEDIRSFNIARWRAELDRDESLHLREGDLVVVDEAGMAPTTDLADIARRCEQAGAKLLLVGDARQLAAVGPGGSLADLGSHALTYPLAKVHRFSNDWEGEASLRVRDGDRVALDQYDKHGRLHDAATPEQAEQAAERAWLADRLAGKDTLLLAGSNEAAGRSSMRIRSELVRLGQVHDAGVAIREDAVAGVGDVVQARRNGWHLEGYEGNTHAPINRTVYRVDGLLPDGGLQVVDGAGVKLRLPASYVQEHVALAYASTVHAAQGRTVDTAHAVVAPGMDASGVYVSLTRGREANHAWIVTQPLPSQAPVGEAQTVEPRAGRAVLGEVLEQATEQRGALAEQAQSAEDAASTKTKLDRLIEGISLSRAGGTATVLDRLTHNEVITEEQRQQLAADRSMPSVERLLRHAELSGHDTEQLLTRVLDGYPLDGARSPAQVLHKRVRDEVGQLAPRISSYTDLIPSDTPPEWRPYLENLASGADDRRHELGGRVAEEPPAWALDTLGPVPADPLARAVWESRAGWAAAHRENVGYDDDTNPLGAAPPAGLPEKHAAWWTAHDSLDLPDVGPEEELLTDGQLRVRVAAWELEKKWAPVYVGDQLAATSEALNARRTDAQLWAAHADATEDAEEAEQLRAAAAKATEEAVELEQKAALLEDADKTRAKWWAHTAVTRDRAERSKTTLESRGVDLDHPDDRTTAAEWMAAHRVDLRRDDRYRPIHETDLAHDEHVDTSVDGEVVETAVPDIRDTSALHPSEHTDQPPVRRVPDRDETAEAVARARDALAEIEARHTADSARADSYDEHIAWWAADHDNVDENVRA